MKINFIYLSFCIAIVAALFIGRCTKTTPVQVDNQHTIDSLNRRIAQSIRLREIYRQNAQKAFQKGLESQKAKVVIRTIYVAEKAKKHALPMAKKDSLIKEMFGVPYADSSRFSKPIANGILDLNSENLALKSGALLDSMTIGNFKLAYSELDTAYQKSGIESQALNGLLTEEKATNKKLNKEIRRQKRFKWVAIIGIFTVSTLAISTN